MIRNKIEMNNLILIYNENLKRKCVDVSEKIGIEIIKKLLVTNKIAGIIAESGLYTSSIELYKIEGFLAVSFAYLHLRHRDNNMVFYSISKELNNLGSYSNEFEYTDCKKAASIIMNDLMGMSNI